MAASQQALLQVRSCVHAAATAVAGTECQDVVMGLTCIRVCFKRSYARAFLFVIVDVHMQQLLAQSQQQSQRAPQVEFKCGKMNKADGATTVTPDLRKGKLTVKADQDQLMHVIWTNREQGT